MSKATAIKLVTPPSEFILAIMSYRRAKKVWPFSLDMVSYENRSLAYWIEIMRKKGLYKLDYSKTPIDTDIMIIEFVFDKGVSFKETTEKTVTLMPTYTVEGQYIFTELPVPSFNIRITHR